MPDWVVEWLWIGACWMAAAVVCGLLAGWLMRHEHDGDER